jgi:hypothetical protein
MPAALERAMNYLRHSRDDAPETFVHFTDAAGAIGIVSDGVLRLCRARCSNDSMEVEYGIRLAKDCLRDEISNQGETNRIFKEAIAGCFNEVPFYGEIKRYPDPHICCLSTSVAKTSVPQWGLYGRNGTGVALVFAGHELRQKKDVDLVRVVYDREEQRALLTEVLLAGLNACIEGRQNALKHGPKTQELIVRIFAHAFGCVAAMYAAVMKHAEFAFEQEWRLSLSDLEMPGGGVDNRFGVTTSGAIVKPYFKCAIRPGDLVEVLVGPAYADRNVPALRELLRYKGYNDGNDDRVPVRIADVSLRA